jgi:hypothetical protein
MKEYCDRKIKMSEGQICNKLEKFSVYFHVLYIIGWRFFLIQAQNTVVISTK